MQTNLPFPDSGQAAIAIRSPRIPAIRFHGLWIAFLISLSGVAATAADRTTLLIPLPHDAETEGQPAGILPDAAFGDASVKGWHAYQRLWVAHYEDPSNAAVRRFLGLPLHDTLEAKTRRGRSAPGWLGWRAGSYTQVDTPHFVIHSRADAESSKRVAEDLERCYWIWTQMFFPLWEASPQVAAALGRLTDDVSIPDYLKTHSQRITVRRKLRVVLFRDAREYQQTLAVETPGIERSTGFYNDERQTTFLYTSKDDDAATRRHEMVHQLFREATRSKLGRKIPGEKTGFWLVEGIAGYFESLVLGPTSATVGGWDASRLQFARYRVLVGGDTMSMAELRADGRLDAQQRSDIARWYAHAILRTHQLLDDGNPLHRRWVYRQLSNRYQVASGIGESDATLDWDDLDRSVTGFLSVDDAHLAANPIAHPLRRLCLAGCEVTETALSGIPPSPELRWLDLAGLPIGNAAVRRLASKPGSVEQLNLERTRVDAKLVDWLRAASSLRELDLSWTRSDDSVVDAIAGAGDISTLWMTGTKVSDLSIDAIRKMRRLESVDLQRTNVTDAGIGRLRAARPQLQVNPLELRSR